MTPFFLGLFWLFSGASVSHAQFTEYESVVAAVFPPALMERKYVKPSESDQAALESYREGIAQLIEASGREWLESLAPGVGERSEADLQAFLNNIRKTPIWVCKKECFACASDQDKACIQVREFGKTLGAAFFVSGCQLPGGEACSGVKPSKKDLLTGFAKAAITFAYYKFGGVKDWSLVKPHVMRTLDVLGNAFASVDRILKHCPSSFDGADLNFLQSAASLAPLNDAWNRCARSAFEGIPKEYEKWLDGLPTAAQRAEVRAFRCNGWCQVLTCASGSTAKPRLIEFGEKRVFSLPEGTCDGERWVKREDAAEIVFQRYGNALWKKQSGDLRAAAIRQWARVPSLAKEQPGPYVFPKAPEVQMIDEW